MFHAQLASGGFNEAVLIFGWDFQRFCQQLGELPGGPAGPHFDFSDGEHAAAGALCQLFLGQVQLLAAAFEPLVEKKWGILLTYGEVSPPSITGSHYP